MSRAKIIYRIATTALLSVALSCNSSVEEHSQTTTDSIVDAGVIPNRQPYSKISSQSTVKVQYGARHYDQVIEGTFVPDDRRTKRIASRLSGRIEKLYVPFALKYVTNGSALMELYSPLINTLASNYTFALNSSDDAIAEQARLGLQQLGLTNRQILDISKNSESPYSLTIYSNDSGYLIPSDDMQLKEGMYVNEGQTLFTINDLRTLWGIGSVRSIAGMEITKGMMAVITSELDPSMPIRARVDFVEPIYLNGDKFTRIRLYVDNSNGQLLVNSNFTAAVSVHNSRFLILPRSVVFDLGKRTIVWKKVGLTKGGASVFESQEVKVTLIGNDEVAVLSGLHAGDEVAAQPGLLIDSDTFLR